MTKYAISVGEQTNTVDFTDSNLEIHAETPVHDLNGLPALIAGDANADWSVNAADRSEAWNSRNLSGYLGADYNLDGVVNAADRSISWNNRNNTGLLP